MSQAIGATPGPQAMLEAAKRCPFCESTSLTFNEWCLEDCEIPTAIECAECFAGAPFAARQRRPANPEETAPMKPSGLQIEGFLLNSRFGQLNDLTTETLRHAEQDLRNARQREAWHERFFARFGTLPSSALVSTPDFRESPRRTEAERGRKVGGAEYPPDLLSPPASRL